MFEKNKLGYDDNDNDVDDDDDEEKKEATESKHQTIMNSSLLSTAPDDGLFIGFAHRPFMYSKCKCANER